MMARSQARISSRPGIALTVLAAAAVATVVVATEGIVELELDGLRAAGSESARVEAAVADAFGSEPVPSVVIAAISPSGSIGDASSKVALRVVRDRVASFAGVAEIRDGEPSADAAATTIEVSLEAGLSLNERVGVLDQIRSDLDAGELELVVGGRLPGLIEARELGSGDALRATLLAIPIILLLLGLALHPRRLAIAVILAALAGGFAAVLVVVADRFADPTVAAVGPAVALGSMIGLESALLLIALVRSRGAIFGTSLGWALGTAMVTTAAAGAAAAVFPAPDLRSAVVAAALAAPIGIVAGALASVASPVFTGTGIEPDPGEPGRWQKLRRRLGSSRIARWSGAAASLGVIAVLTAGSVNITPISFGPAELPSANSARLAEDAIERAGGRGRTEPVILTAERGGPSALDRDLIAGLRDREEIVGIETLQSAPGRYLAAIRAEPTAGSQAAQEQVGELRHLGATVDWEIGGRSAATIDLAAKLRDGVALVLVAGLVGLIAALLVSLRTVPWRSRVPTCLLTATLGLLAPATGLGALGYLHDGQPHLGSLIGVVVVLTGLAAFRTVSDAGSATALRPARVRAMTVSTAVGVVVGLALAGSAMAPLAEFGRALAAGIAVDLLAIRLMLMPMLVGALIPNQPST